MIEKAIAYKKIDKDVISSLKKLGLSKYEINFILKKYKRKKFEDGGDSGGDSGGQGDSGPGGSDDGSGHGGPGDSGPGDSGPGGSDDGTGHGGPGPGPGGAEGGFGIGPDAAQEAAQSAAQSISQDNISMQAQADMEDASRAAAAQQSGITNAINAVKNYAMNPATIGRTLGMAAFGIPGAIAGGMIGSNIGRGVTAPDDFSQLDTSVQSGPAQDSSGSGINTINQFAPLYNTSTGDNTADAMRARLNVLLDVKPTVYGIPAAVNQLSNYSLLDLSNFRK